MPSVELYILVVLGLSYVVRILLLTDDFGPFESDAAVVISRRGDEQQTRPVNLFDRVRRLTGAYRVEKQKGIIFWNVWWPRAAVWSCPKCLSFWLTMLGSLPYSLYRFGSVDGRTLVVHLSMTFVVSTLVFLELNLEKRV